MFTQNCFIRKNTKELQEKLEEIGRIFPWKANNCPVSEFDLNAYLLCVGDKYFKVPGEEGSNYEGIDCNQNEELFLALAALRDDIDENQWFIMDVEIYTNIHKGSWFKATDKNGTKCIGLSIDSIYCHKASVQEILEHFLD